MDEERLDRAEAAEARVVELEAVRDGEVLVEGSWFKRAELSTILGNFMRASDQHAREAKDAMFARDAAVAETAALRDVVERVLSYDGAGMLHASVRLVLSRALAVAVPSVPTEQPETTEPESMTWWGHRANCSLDPVHVLSWIKRLGGEARYVPKPAGHQGEPRIIITGPDGDVIVRPGDTVVMGEWFCVGPSYARAFRREFSVRPAKGN